MNAGSSGQGALPDSVAEPGSGDRIVDEARGTRREFDAVMQAKRALLDEARPAAVEFQRKRGRWTARAVVAALADPHSFVEYQGLARAGFAGMDAPADGLVMGLSRINGVPTDLMLYDYSVYAGTQGAINHIKMSRMFEHALRYRYPVVLWLDGGGARTQDMLLPARQKATCFTLFAKLSGLAPSVGVVPGNAFAGHANLAGMCDFLIGLRGSALGMGGPPLVESALGIKYKPTEIGPAEMHEKSGVYDLVVEDDGSAIEAARRYLSYFGPAQAPGAEHDQSTLRDIIPDNPRQAYDVRKVIETLADVGSVMEIRPVFGACIVTAFMRLGGKAVGVVANQPTHMAGAIDSDGSTKAARFVSICDAFDIPLLVLCDTPGLMVGPDAEATGLARHSARLMMAIANATTPMMTVVLRKAYGLGYYVMGSASLDPAVLLAWPTAEYGGMGHEGAVNILHRKELDAIADIDARNARRSELTEAMKEEHKAVLSAGRLTYDDVIDPADTREILRRVLEALPEPAPRVVRKRLIEPF